MTDFPVIVDLLFFLLPIVFALLAISVAWGCIKTKQRCDTEDGAAKRYCETTQFKVMFIIASVFLIICQFSWWGSQYLPIDHQALAAASKITWLIYTVFINLIFIVVLKNCEIQSLLARNKR